MPSVIEGLRCYECGSDQIVSVSPGFEPIVAPGGILISRGQPVKATCLECWPPLAGYQQSLFVEYPV